MRSHLRAVLAALAAGTLLGLFAGTGCSAEYCKENHNDFFCGGEGVDAPPEPQKLPPSACQPRAVMPVFFSLVESKDPSFAGLRGALADLGKVECLIPADRSCTNDDQCALGSCVSGLCPCQVSHSPLTDVLGVTLRAMAAIAKDPVEAPGLKAPGCLSPAQAAELAPEKRSRICELRRMLDILLQSSGGSSLVDDPAIRKVLISLLDYVNGKTDCDAVTGVCKSHYDLLEPVGRMAGANTDSCNPASLWTLLDNALGYLTPELASKQLGAIQILLADPQTKSLLTQLAGQGGSSGGRDGIIVLLHSFTPGIVAAADAPTALAPIFNLLNSLVFQSANYPQSFKDELRTAVGIDPNTNTCAGQTPWAAATNYAKNAQVVANGNVYVATKAGVSASAGTGPVGTGAGIADNTVTWSFVIQAGLCQLLGTNTGIFPPLQSVLKCAGSAQVRCSDPANCDKNDDELVGALYDILAKPEDKGGVDLATLVGALKSLTTLDQTGQTGRTLRLIIQGIEGSQDPNDVHEARDAVAALAAEALTAEEGKKLVPALSVLIEKQVVGELLDLVHDLLYTCTPPPATH